LANRNFLALDIDTNADLVLQSKLVNDKLSGYFM